MPLRAEIYKYVPPLNRQGADVRRPIVDLIKNKGGAAALLNNQLRGKVDLESVVVYDQVGESYWLNEWLMAQFLNPNRAEVVMHRSDGNDGEIQTVGTLRHDGHTALVQVRRLGLAVVTLYKRDGDYDSGEYPGMTEPANIFVL